FSGDTLMLGYYKKPEATDEIVKIHPDGQRWIHTGDLGYITETGVLFITGRIKRIIMTKGKDGVVTKMFPDRIEKTVLEHPAVGLCCVIGVPDETRIHYAKAVTVLNAGYVVSEELTKEILENCKYKLPEYMIPEEIEYRAELPRTERGKVDYRALGKEAVQ
ncbi:MAG: acyl--CoA ligase, partial [Lachnospiraceae bacterium]|nr:acyl--CoA ligase [Lachnospiraceae bacterium]